MFSCRFCRRHLINSQENQAEEKVFGTVVVTVKLNVPTAMAENLNNVGGEQPRRQSPWNRRDHWPNEHAAEIPRQLIWISSEKILTLTFKMNQGQV